MGFLLDFLLGCGQRCSISWNQFIYPVDFWLDLFAERISNSMDFSVGREHGKNSTSAFDSFIDILFFFKVDSLIEWLIKKLKKYQTFSVILTKESERTLSSQFHKWVKDGLGPETESPRHVEEGVWGNNRLFMSGRFVRAAAEAASKTLLEICWRLAWLMFLAVCGKSSIVGRWMEDSRTRANNPRKGQQLLRDAQCVHVRQEDKGPSIITRHYRKLGWFFLYFYF